MLLLLLLLLLPHDASRGAVASRDGSCIKAVGGAANLLIVIAAVPTLLSSPRWEVLWQVHVQWLLCHAARGTERLLAVAGSPRYTGGLRQTCSFIIIAAKAAGPVARQDGRAHCNSSTRKLLLRPRQTTQAETVTALLLAREVPDGLQRSCSGA